MKKGHFLLLIAVIIFSLTSCTSVSHSSTRNLDSTPENSVLVYGGIFGFSEASFSQMDTNYLPDYQIIESKSLLGTDVGSFCLLPVEPGTCYRIVYLNAISNEGNFKYFIDQYFSLDGSVFDFVVPDESGLYYYGFLDFPSSIKQGEKVVKSKLYELQFEHMALKNAKKMYEGTDWEPLINKRIDELEVLIKGN